MLVLRQQNNFLFAFKHSSQKEENFTRDSFTLSSFHKQERKNAKLHFNSRNHGNLESH